MPTGFVSRERVSPHHETSQDFTGDNSQPVSREWMEETASRVLYMLDRLNTQIFDTSREFDTYPAQSSAVETETLITALASYETADERVESIIVTGPVTATPATVGPAFTLQLGGRIWNLALPVTGILTIGPVACRLERSDIRQLTSAVAGDWAFELMGHADIPYRRP
jgi:hypothetical protein